MTTHQLRYYTIFVYCCSSNNRRLSDGKETLSVISSSSGVAVRRHGDLPWNLESPIWSSTNDGRNNINTFTHIDVGIIYFCCVLAWHLPHDSGPSCYFPCVILWRSGANQLLKQGTERVVVVLKQETAERRRSTGKGETMLLLLLPLMMMAMRKRRQMMNKYHGTNPLSSDRWWGEKRVSWVTTTAYHDIRPCVEENLVAVSLDLIQTQKEPKIRCSLAGRIGLHK